MGMMKITEARKRTQPEKLGQLPFFNRQRVETLMADVLGELTPENRTTSPDPRIRYEWNQRVMERDPARIPTPALNPWDIPGTYDDPEASDEILRRIDNEFHSATDLAIRWRTLGDVAAGAGAIRVIKEWAVNYTYKADIDKNDNGALVWSSRWPVLIQATMMVRDHPDYTPEIEAAMRASTLNGAHISMANRADNNTGTWGIVWEFAAAALLADRDRFDAAALRWQSNLNNGVKNNIPIHEIYRQGGIIVGNGKDGLWYSNFFMMALTIAAEWARFGGIWLYDSKCPDGSSFKGLAMQVREWTRFPNTYPYNTSSTPTTTGRILPHDDILHALWPTAESQWLIDNFPNGNDRDSSGVRGTVLAYRYRPLWG